MEIEKKPKKLWFKAKQYGFGWYPVSWQGWLLLWLYIFCLGYYVVTVMRSEVDPWDMALQICAAIVGLTSLLIWFCVKRGEKAKWRWDVPKNESKNDQ